MENAFLSVVNGRHLVKFSIWVGHHKPIAHTKQNLETSTYVTDNDVIMFKFERFHRNPVKPRAVVWLLPYVVTNVPSTSHKKSVSIRWKCDDICARLFWLIPMFHDI